MSDSIDSSNVLLIGPRNLDVIIDKSEAPGKISPHKISFLPGGVCINVGRALYWLGLEPYFSTNKVDSAKQELVSIEIPVGHWSEFKQVPTYVSILNEQGEKEATFFDRDEFRIDSNRLRDAIQKFDPKGVIIISTDLPNKIFQQVVKYASSKNKICILAAAPDDIYRINEWLPNADIFIGNLEEAQEILRIGGEGRKGAEDASRAFHNRGLTTVLVTAGEMGAVSSDSDGSLYYHESLIDACEIKSTLAAGDAFAAGFLKGIISTGDYQRGLNTGSKCARVLMTSPPQERFNKTNIERLQSIKDDST